MLNTFLGYKLCTSLCRSFIGADCAFEEWKRVYDAFSSTWGYGMIYFIAVPGVSIQKIK